MQFPVQIPIAYRLRYMRRLDTGTSFQVGNGTGYFENAIMRPGRKTQPGHGQLQELFTLGIGFTIAANLPGKHMGIAINSGISKSFLLDIPSSYHPFPYSAGIFSFTVV